MNKMSVEERLEIAEALRKRIAGATVEGIEGIEKEYEPKEPHTQRRPQNKYKRFSFVEIRILALLEKRGSLKQKEIVESLKIIDKSSISRGLKRLLDKDVISKTKEGLYYDHQTYYHSALVENPYQWLHRLLPEVLKLGYDIEIDEVNMDISLKKALSPETAEIRTKSKSFPESFHEL